MAGGSFLSFFKLLFHFVFMLRKVTYPKSNYFCAKGVCNMVETITRLNEAQDTLIQAQNQLIVSAVEFNKAAAQLAAATGAGR
jgi:hypothetical protein